MSFTHKSFRIKNPFDYKKNYCRNCIHYDECVEEIMINGSEKCCRDYLPTKEYAYEYYDNEIKMNYMTLDCERTRFYNRFMI